MGFGSGFGPGFGPGFGQGGGTSPQQSVVDTIAILIPRTRFREGSWFVAKAYFRESGTAATPTNVYYRIDNLTTGKRVSDWSPLSPSGSVDIAVTSEHNAITAESNARELLQLTVDADHGLSTQVREAAIWEVENVRLV